MARAASHSRRVVAARTRHCTDSGEPDCCAARSARACFVAARQNPPIISMAPHPGPLLIRLAANRCLRMRRGSAMTVDSPSVFRVRARIALAATMGAAMLGARMLPMVLPLLGAVVYVFAALFLKRASDLGA